MDSVQIYNPENIALLKTHFERCWSCAVAEDFPGAEIAAGTHITVAFAVPGARAGDPAVASLTSLNGWPLMITAHTTGVANNVMVIIYNPTAAPIILPAGDFTACVRVRYGL